MRPFIQLQNQFQSYLLDNNDAFLNKVIDTKKVSKNTRLEIYKNAYQLRLQEALGDSYSALRRYLGNKTFDKLCIEYIKIFPSSYRSIRWYGDQFPAFLQSHKKYKKKLHISELAEWEWASSLVFDAKDAIPLTLDSMAAVPAENWESLQFHCHPSLRFMELNWNTVEIWEQLSDEKMHSNPVKNKMPILWILWRKDFVCHYRMLDPEESYAINAICAHKTFGEICEGLCHFVSEDEAGQKAASLLKGWIMSGLLTQEYAQTV